MSRRDDTSPAATTPSRTPPVRSRGGIGVAIAVVVCAGVGAFVWVRNSKDSSKHHAAKTTTVAGVNAEVVSPSQLRSIAATAGGSVYWLGLRAGTKLEYTQKRDGTTYVRYLTGAATAGAPGAKYVVVATYREADAYARVKRTATQQHLFVAQLPNGAIAVSRFDRPQNLYVVFRDAPYQIEVYTPTQVETRRIVFGDSVEPVR